MSEQSTGKQEPYGYLWFDKSMERRFSHRVPKKGVIGDAVPVYIAPRRLPGPLWEIVMHDQNFQDSLLDYHNYGGSSARVAKAAMKAIGEE
jgi:hypothetical protein